MATIKVTGVKLGGLLEQLKVKLKSYGRIRAEAGYFENATYPGGKRVAEVAYINEYGFGHNPERPFLKTTVEKNRRKWLKIIQDSIKGKIDDPATVERAFSLAAQTMEGDIRQTILDWPKGKPRPNKPKTIERKRKRAESTPEVEGQTRIDPETALQDTTVMLKAVAHKVTK